MRCHVVVRAVLGALSALPLALRASVAQTPPKPSASASRAKAPEKPAAKPAAKPGAKPAAKPPARPAAASASAGRKAPKQVPARKATRGRQRSAPEVPVRAAADDSAAAREARAAFDRYAQAFNAGRDVDAMAFYSDDSRFHWLEDGQVAYTNAGTIRESLARVRALYPVMTFEPAAPRTTVLARDLVVLSVPFVQRLADGAGVETRFEGVMSLVVTKASGSWRVLVGHTSMRRPGAAR